MKCAGFANSWIRLASGKATGTVARRASLSQVGCKSYARNGLEEYRSSTFWGPSRLGSLRSCAGGMC